jgi:hypothetical protein
VSLKRQETELKTALKLPTTISVYIPVGAQGAQRRHAQGAQQEGVGRACQAEARAGTSNCRGLSTSSATQEESKASSTASGKEGIDGIEGVSSAGARARGGSSSSDESGVGSSLGTGTTAGTGPTRPNRRVHSSSIKRSMRGRRISRRVSSSKEREVIFDADGAEASWSGNRSGGRHRSRKLNLEYSIKRSIIKKQDRIIALLPFVGNKCCIIRCRVKGGRKV